MSEKNKKTQHTVGVTFLVGRSTLQQLIENVKSALILSLSVSSRLFQQVAFDVGAADETRSVEIDANEFALWNESNFAN